MGGSVYERVADSAASKLGHDVSDETVKGWIRRCKDAGLLKPDALRRPLKPHTTTDQENRP
jgi:hypothetical protein